MNWPWCFCEQGYNHVFETQIISMLFESIYLPPKLIPKFEPRSPKIDPHIWEKKVCLKINISRSYKKNLRFFSWWFFSSKIFHQQYFHENFHKHFSWKLFASKFSLRFFFRICFRIAGQEFSPGSNGGTPRLQIGLGKKIQTIFDSRVWAEGWCMGESSVGQLK